MKNIVFVLEKYSPERSANVSCVENIIDVLKKEDCKITVICASEIKTGIDSIDGIEIHRIKHIPYGSKLNRCSSAVKKGFLKLIHFIKSVFVLPIYPNVTPVVSCKVFKRPIDIHRKHKIDCVICVFQPYFPVAAALMFKRLYSDISVLGYYLDVPKGANRPFGVPQSVFEKLCDNSQVRDFLKYDAVILPECSKMYYENEKYERFRNKIVYLNFPTFLKSNYVGDKSSDSLNFVYAGTTDSVYRNPLFSLSIFMELRKYRPELQFHLYGRSDIVDELRDIEKKTDGAFVYHGIVSKEEADLAIRNADYCVNYGNNVAGMVPSKVFELISTGKSIIHFTPGDSDSSKKYLEKYEKAHIVDCQRTNEEIVADFISFLDSEKTEIPYSALESIFYSATPEAVAKEILKMV